MVKLVRMVIAMDGWQVVMRLRSFFVRWSFCRMLEPWAVRGTLRGSPDACREFCTPQPSSPGCRMLGGSKVERLPGGSSASGTCKDTFVPDVGQAAEPGPTDAAKPRRSLPPALSCSPSSAS